jgi:hypothetical protein
MLYNWTTYPLTTLLSNVWKMGHDAITQKRHPDPVLVELCSALERALNFMHTGNVAVIATSAMNPLWIGLSIIHDGLPCINPAVVPSLTPTVFIEKLRWPFNTRVLPVSASRCAQIRTYGLGQYNVCLDALYHRSLFYTSLQEPCLTHFIIGLLCSSRNGNTVLS